jgi:hypothetical protein
MLFCLLASASGASTYVSVIPGLREIDLYEWQEQSKKELAKKWPAHWAAWGADPARFALPESGKTPVVDLWRRADTVWGEIRGAPPGFAAPDLNASSAEECDLDDLKCRCAWGNRMGKAIGGTGGVLSHSTFSFTSYTRTRHLLALNTRLFNSYLHELHGRT